MDTILTIYAGGYNPTPGPDSRTGGRALTGRRSTPLDPGGLVSRAQNTLHPTMATMRNTALVVSD